MLQQIFALLLLPTMLATAFWQGDDQPKSGRLGNEKPTIYIKAECQSEAAVRLRLYNNTRWAVAVPTFSLYVNPKKMLTVKLSNGETAIALPSDRDISSIYYYVERDGVQEDVDVPKLNYSDSFNPSWIASNESIFFTVPKEHLREGLKVYVPFNYEWEISRQGVIHNEPRHKVFFRGVAFLNMDEPATCQQAAYQPQDDLRAKVYQAVSRPFPGEAEASRKELLSLGAPAIPFIAEAVQSAESLTLPKKAFLVDVIARMSGQQSASALISLQRDDDPFVRGLATSYVGRQRLKAAIPQLISLLDDKGVYKTIVQTDPYTEQDVLVRDVTIEALQATTGLTLAQQDSKDEQVKAWQSWWQKQKDQNRAETTARVALPRSAKTTTGRPLRGATCTVLARCGGNPSPRP